MSAGDYILLIVSIYFPPLSNQLQDPHLLPWLSEVERFFCATSRNTFALFTRHLSLTEDYLSSVSCQYFTAVGGESSPFPDDTPVCFKTKPLLRDHRCMSPSVNRYQHRIHLKGQCGCTMAIREHLGRVSLSQSRTVFCSSEKVSFDLVPK